MEANKEWCAQTCTRRREAKLYLKTIYRDNCKAKDQCRDHCTAFAVNNPADADYRIDCSHDHNTSCNDREALKKAIQEIHSAIEKYSSKINNRKEDDLRHDAPVAEEKVKEWKAHMHAHNQEKCEQSILLSLLEDEVFILSDWAMKFLQIKFREKQSELLAKRGVNWHLCSVIVKKGGKLEVSSYAHLLNSCSQDWFAVLSILEQLMTVIKISHPTIKKVYLRSDEVGCNHNSSLIAALRDVESRQGIDVVRYDSSEPQHGKDICDRTSCPMKAAVKRFCNDGHDILTAQDMQTVLKERPVRGTTAGEFCMNDKNITLKLKKIRNFSAVHNFEFTPDELGLWKAFKIGASKLIVWNDIIFCPQEGTCLSEEKPFFAILAREMDETTTHHG